jgi:hypothetical protein
VANIACTAALNCCSTCGSVFPALMQPTVAEAQQKTTEYSLSPHPTARHHQAIPEGYNLEEKNLSENRPVPPAL